jgi:uncharacterized membrane protein YhhN
MKPLKNFPAIFFLVILIGDVMAILLQKDMLHLCLKPLLIPSLLWMIYAMLNTLCKLPIGWISAGLLFAWAGDIFLLFDAYNPLFFLLGLSSFLITHILYIIFFVKSLGQKMKGKTTISGIDIIIGIYGMILMYLLWNGLGTMKVPVIIYATCICTMAITCMRCKSVMPERIWKWLALGAMLFVISDSILAINKFLSASAVAPPLVMLTYGLAQLFIAVGAASLFQVKPDAAPTPAE